ncbi:SfnB family sulfur acquisition oxidoreductase [Nocardia thailandica]|uniref:SfnB family sulfur acquisition oxidoreductase n=1 Tax=Nocardia thailandica TaxID=257275 RepID=UPI0002F56027|nr:SfnB family sulfur acquisition oxidoreductase [Nocardia thailandica]
MTEFDSRPRAAVLTGPDEAVDVAARLAAAFAAGAAERDAHRVLPVAELDQLSDSGLLAISVPREFGGADVPTETVVTVFRLLAAADPGLAQIPHSHFVYVEALRRTGTPEQQRYFFGEVLAGKRFGNAQSEAGTKHVQDYRTRLRARPDGGFVLDGLKHYATGAYFAHWIPVLAKDDGDRLVVAYVPRDAAGVTVVDDWDGMGQRITASGSVELSGVRVPAEHVLPHHQTFDGPQLYGARAQILHAAIDTGIARGALGEAAEFVRTTARPWFEAGVEHATEDPLTVQRFGELEVAVRAAEALLGEAARTVDTAANALDDDSAAAASVAVAVAKAAADRAALEVTNALFELGGTRSALDSLNLHRHWRNARTHTLHDPVRWKFQHIGRYLLTGTPPPRHGVL